MDLNNFKGLPNTVEVSGSLFFLETDFRVWLDYARFIETRQDWEWENIKFLFEDISGNQPMITIELVEEINHFFRCSDYYPISNETGENIIDFKNDLTYIYAAFMRVYKIDLMTSHLHWHQFMSLLRGLSTQYESVLEIRSYEGNDSDCNIRKNQWRVQQKVVKTEEEIEMLEYLKSLRKGG